MPELPEVESVRIGAQEWFSGRTISEIRVLHSRAVRHHDQGASDFERRLEGVTLGGFSRRGKFMWTSLDSGEFLICHLGMSGQIRACEPAEATDRHLRVAAHFVDGRKSLCFVDQRTFGYLRLDEASLGSNRAVDIPASLNHIAPDPFDPEFDLDRAVDLVKKKVRPIKSVLLDQSVVSGIGNIYADEALWRAEVRGGTSAARMSKPRIRTVLTAATEVMAEAIAVGGTSFDSLYVNVNGDSGYFERSLNAYGRAGQFCPRCSSLIRREVIGGRSSYFCSQCQRLH